jgi:hypothetical protein
LKTFILIIMLVAFSGVAQAENKIIEEIQNWDFSLGGMAYLKNADTFYYSCGAKRDLGQFFNWLDNERLYGELGYLNTHMVNNTAEIGEKAFGYAGLSTNANFIAQTGISGLNKLLDANITTPEILDKVLATVGLVGAKKLDGDFWDLRRGYDWGVNVSVLKIEW